MDDSATLGDPDAEPSLSGQETTLPGAEPSDTSSEARSAPLAGAQRCTDDVVGYEIAYPAGWVTNDGDVLPTCRLFDSASTEVEAGIEIPLDIAVSLRTTDHVLADIAEDDDGVTVLATSRTTVDGHEVVVVHKRGNGEAVVPEDVRFTQHVIDLGQQRFVASTFDVGASYEVNREVLAAMVQSLEVFDDAGTDDQEDQAARRSRCRRRGRSVPGPCQGASGSSSPIRRAGRSRTATAGSSTRGVTASRRTPNRTSR